MYNMEQREVRCWIALGGLLHDIGKLVDRAGLGEEYSEGLKEDFKYNHARYSYNFVRQIFEGKVNEEVKELVLSCAYHHKPRDGNIYDRIQQLADWCASSERSKREEENPHKKEEKRLKSVFSLVSLKGECKPGLEGYYEHRLNSLRLDRETLFPVEVSGEGHGGEYKTLLEGLKNSLRNIDFKDCHRALLRLYYILYKYLWCVPASTYDMARGTAHFPDISLFDHSRVASALASSLWTDYNRNKLQGIEGVEFILLEGDITGIQKFLYQLTNTKGVGKRLRGRSFFLSVLPAILGRFFLKELGYPVVNLLYASGGKFQMILGYEEGIEDRLKELQEKADEVLVREFGGHLGMVLGWLRLKGSELDVETLGQKIQELYDHVGERKFKKFLGLLDRFEDLVNRHPGHYEICPSCMVSQKLEEEEYCKWCEVFQKVGAKIPRAEYLVFSYDGGDVYLPGLGGVFVAEKRNESTSGDRLLLNNTDFEGKADGFFFLANTVPLEGDEVKDFNELVEEEELGYELLTFLKADVDNLGLVFSQGLREDYSLSRVATLSRGLDLFFSGYINTFLQKEFKNKVYVVYSGGDDLFLCTPWETALELAHRLEEEFSQYTCNNQCFTLSMGFFFQKPNYPIRFGAEGAEEEKEVAKTRKNSVSLWKTPIPWEEYKELLRGLESFLLDFNPWEHRTLLYRIYQLLGPHKMDGKFSMKFYPLFYYQISRNLKSEREQKSLEELILNPREDYKIKDHAEISLRLALMKTRRLSEKTKGRGYYNNVNKEG